jgi:hypothetical protein
MSIISQNLNLIRDRGNRLHEKNGQLHQITTIIPLEDSIIREDIANIAFQSIRLFASRTELGRIFCLASVPIIASHV